jgi:2-keto-4-pentenoate hydratase
MSNGGLVCGEPRADWRDFDFSTLTVRQVENGAVAVEGVGGHSAGDPLKPAVALVNLLRRDRGVLAGQIVTTGTFTGLRFLTPGATLHTEFVGFGEVELRFKA